MDKTKPYNELKPISTLEIMETSHLRNLAEDTRVAIEILDYAVKTLPSANILLDTLYLQEAKVSSKIENIITTNDELYKGIILNYLSGSEKEVVNYKDAMFKGISCLQEKGYLSPNDIIEINSLINNKTLGIRKELPGFENDITRISRLYGDGALEIIYTPPQGEELLLELLIDMIDYVYDDENYTIHPLIKIALAHYQFESIHPFKDGNGRTGRILNILFMCKKEYLSFPYLYASSYILQTKSTYYKLLQSTREDNSYELIIEYLLTSFKKTAEKTRQVVEQIKDQLKIYTEEEFIRSLKGQKNILLSMVELIYKKVYVRIDDLVQMGIHRQTASTYLKQFVELGLLKEEKVGKEKIFKNIKLLQLFEEKPFNEETVNW